MSVRRNRISIEKTDSTVKPWAWTVEWLCHTEWRVSANGNDKTFDKALASARKHAQPYRSSSSEAGRYEEFNAYSRLAAPALVRSVLGCGS